MHVCHVHKKCCTVKKERKFVTMPCCKNIVDLENLFTMGLLIVQDKSCLKKLVWSIYINMINKHL